MKFTGKIDQRGEQLWENGEGEEINFVSLTSIIARTLEQVLNQEFSKLPPSSKERIFTASDDREALKKELLAVINSSAGRTVSTLVELWFDSDGTLDDEIIFSKDLLEKITI